MEESILKIDELIIEYMIYRIKLNLKPRFTITEFMDFLKFFKTKLKLEDTLDNGLELFKRFFERKDEEGKYYSSIYYIDYTRKDPLKDKKEWPKITMEYSKEENDYIIKAGSQLCNHDGSYNIKWYKKPVNSIKVVMDEYLANEQKMTIDENVFAPIEKLQIGKQIAAKMIKEIWLSYAEYKVENKSWPYQCRDFNKYFLEMDLAPIIGLDSMKERLLELYSVLSKRIAILYTQDDNLRINSVDNEVLSNQNYKLLIQGYERLVGIAYGEYKKDLEIDFSKLNIKEAYEYGTSYWDCDADVKIDNTKISNEKLKNLSQDIDREIKNNKESSSISELLSSEVRQLYLDKDGMIKTKVLINQNKD